MNSYFRTPDRELNPPEYDDGNYTVYYVEVHRCMTCGELSQSEFCNEFCHETYLT